MKRSLTSVAISLARDNLPGLVSYSVSNTINKTWKKNEWKRSCKSRKGSNLFVSNEGMNDIIKIIKSLENSDVLIDGVTETVKYETKKQGDRFLGALVAPLADLLGQLVISSVVKGISERGIRKARKRYMDKNF